MTTTKSMPTSHNKRKKHIFFILIAILCITGGILYRLHPLDVPIAPTAQEQTPIAVATNNAVEDGDSMNYPELSTQPPAQPVRLIISNSPIFETAKAKGSLQIANHKDNKDLILQVRLLDKDGGLLYVSPILKPNQKIESDYLKRQDLPAGEYSVQAIFDYYKSDKSHYYSTAANITLCIQK